MKGFKFTRRKLKLEDIFPLVLSVTLLTVVVLIAWVSFTGSTPKESEDGDGQVSTPTQMLPKVTDTFNFADTVLIDVESNRKLLEKLKNRVPLTTNDTEAKANILSLLPSGNSSGIVYQTKNIIIEYIEPVDEFQVEIQTIDIAQAKAEANVWFRGRGMSQQGICNLPVNFTLNREVAEYLNTHRIIFNVLANSC